MIQAIKKMLNKRKENTLNSLYRRKVEINKRFNFTLSKFCGERGEWAYCKKCGESYPIVDSEIRCNGRNIERCMCELEQYK